MKYIKIVVEEKKNIMPALETTFLPAQKKLCVCKLYLVVKVVVPNVPTVFAVVDCLNVSCTQGK